MSVRSFGGRALQATPAGERIVCIGRIWPVRSPLIPPQRMWTVSVRGGYRYDWPEGRS